MPKVLGKSLIVLLVLAAGHAVAQTAQAWLDRMNRTVEELNYQGTFVHVFGGSAETLHIVHRNLDGRIGERIVSLNGIGREIIRHEDKVQCILPDRRTVLLLQEGRHSSPLAAALPSYSEELVPYYDFKLYRTARVANRPTQVVGIKPKDEFRYGYVLWLDEETAMPLKSQLRSETGEIIEQILFTDFKTSDSIPESALEPGTDTKGFTWFRPQKSSDADDAEQASAPWRVASLPSGFALSAVTQRPIAGSQYPVEHLVYSDGLATVSVFIEDPKNHADLAEGFSTLGSTNAYSLTIRGRKVTAIGEVPRETVQQIATSLIPE